VLVIGEEDRAGLDVDDDVRPGRRRLRRRDARRDGDVTRLWARRAGGRWREKDADEQHYERDTRGQRSTAGHRANQGRRVGS
jgi:hypothetical protein